MLTGFALLTPFSIKTEKQSHTELGTNFARELEGIKQDNGINGNDFKVSKLLSYFKIICLVLYRDFNPIAAVYVETFSILVTMCYIIR